MTPKFPMYPVPAQTAQAVRLAGGLVALSALVLACFGPALTGPFLFDDFPHLGRLAALGGQLDAEALSRYLAALDGVLSRPLAALSFLIEDATWPAYPYDFKRDNLLFHLLTGILVMPLARMLAEHLGLPRPRADWFALVLSAMWLLHPMQLSATMLVVQRMNILASAFVLAGLALYAGILARERWAPLARVVAAGATLAAFGLLAFLCKENGILILAYAAVLNFTVLAKRVEALPATSRRLLIAGTLLPLVALVAAAALHPSYVMEGYARRDFTLGERLLTQPRVLFDYLGNILLPRIGGQGIFHDGYVASRSLVAPWSTLPALVALVIGAGSAIVLRKRAPAYAFAVLWFLAGHAMESSFIALELYFEHRNYLPMIGPLFALAWTAFAAAPTRRPLALAVLAAWLLVCASLTYVNARVWGNRGTLALVWLEENPRSSRAVQLATSFYNDLGDYPAARRVLDAGLARMPDDGDLNPQSFLLDCLHVGMTPARWAAFERYARETRTIGILPEVVSAFRRQATGPACQGTLSATRFRGLVGALLANEVVASDRATVGYLHYELAKLAEHERNLDLTMRELDLAYRFRPNPMIPREQAFLLLTAGLPAEALSYLDLSDRTLDPGIESWLTDMPARNLDLRRSARAMLDARSRQRAPDREPPEAD